VSRETVAGSSYPPLGSTLLIRPTRSPRMLEDANFAEIVSWGSAGDSFVVKAGPNSLEGAGNSS
jgi:hypothetical protein